MIVKKDPLDVVEPNIGRTASHRTCNYGNDIDEAFIGRKSYQACNDYGLTKYFSFWTNFE